MSVKVVAQGAISDKVFRRVLEQAPPELHEQILMSLQVSSLVIPMEHNDKVSVGISLAATIIDSIDDPDEALYACESFMRVMSDSADKLIEQLKSTKH